MNFASESLVGPHARHWRHFLYFGVAAVGIGLLWRFVLMPPLTEEEEQFAGDWESDCGWNGPLSTYVILHLEAHQPVDCDRYDANTSDPVEQNRYQAWRIEKNELVLHSPIYWDSKRHRPARGEERYRIDRICENAITLTLVEVNGRPCVDKTSFRFQRLLTAR